MIEVEQSAWQTMVSHAERVYPNECCGAMLGHTGGDYKTVIEAVPLENAWSGPQGDHYLIRPPDLMAVEKQARQQGMDLVGIFHSHPDSAAYFSHADLKNSCPWYSFVVLSIRAGQFDHARSFLPDPDQTQAEEEELKWQKS